MHARSHERDHAHLEALEQRQHDLAKIEGTVVECDHDGARRRGALAAQVREQAVAAQAAVSVSREKAQIVLELCGRHGVVAEDRHTGVELFRATGEQKGRHAAVE